MYLSPDLIIKSEEPMVFSKLQGSFQNNNAQLKSRNKQKNRYHLNIIFSIVKSYCLRCCEVLRPQLFFEFTLGIEEKRVSESVNVVILWSLLPTSR